MFSKGIQPFDFIKYNVIQKLAYKVQYISQINGDLLMFFRNVRIRFFKLDGSVVNNYGKNTRKRNTINIQLNLPNSNLKGERSELIWTWIRETVELRNKMRLCHFSIYIPGRFIHALKLVSKIKTFKKINQILKDRSMVIMTSLLVRSVEKFELQRESSQRNLKISSSKINFWITEIQIMERKL